MDSEQKQDTDSIRLSEVQFLLDESRIQAAELLRTQLRRFNPQDLAELLEDLDPDDKIRLVEALETETAAEVIDETDGPSREHVLSAFTTEKISEIVEALPPDEGADLVSDLPDEQRDEVLEGIEKKRADDVRELLAYPPDSAGGVMTTEFFTVLETDSVQSALTTLRETPKSETFVDLYVTDVQGKLIGSVAVRDLLEHDPTASIAPLLDREPVSVTPETDQEDVAFAVTKYNLNAVPVVDDNGVLRGVITVDDVIDVIEDEVDEDMYRMAGTASRDPSREPLLKKYLKRMPFLATTFVGGVTTIIIHHLFRTTTEEIVAIAFYVPLIIGLSGNVGLQASTIMVRGFATGDVELHEIMRLLPLEVGTGFLIGLSFGTLCGGVTYFLASSLGATPVLGIVVGVAMTLGTTFAASFGTLIPAFCEWVGIDPAIAAGPFIVTLIDAFVVTLYLAIAAALVSAL